jgi:putative tryptophan/tyrosine transport system substrate-binding protein
VAQRLARKGLDRGQEPARRYHAKSPDRLPALAAELIALSPDLLVATNPQAAVALKSATANIPIVFVVVFDPVGIGLVQSLSRPGGNITGLATYVPGDWIPKRVQILRELIPSASNIALLVNPQNPIHRLTLAEEAPRTAQSLGVTRADELEVAFSSAAQTFGCNHRYCRFPDY